MMRTNKRTSGTRVLLATVGAACLSIGLVSTAAADSSGPVGRGTNETEPDTGAEQSGKEITVYSNVSITHSGSMPDGGEEASTSPNAPPFPCGFITGVWTGPEYMKYYQDHKDEKYHHARHERTTKRNWPPKSQIKAHADDGKDKGMWAGRYCYASSDYYTEAQMDRIIDEWFNETQDHVWVPTGQEPALTEPPPVEYLAQVAVDQLRVPTPELDRNPEGRSYVNLKTWFWVPEEQTEQISVRAGVMGTWAKVTVRPTKLTISSPVAQRSCPASEASTAYNESLDPEAQSTECYIVFPKASVEYPDGYPVTATMHWVPTFTSNPGMANPPDLDSVEVHSEETVPVAEIQTEVNG